MVDLNPPKGTRDFPPGSLEIRKRIIKLIEEEFEKANFEKWEGPAIEHLEILTKKSGPEVEKEIYSFEDKAGRKIGLRFDLTTQLSRIIASHPELKKPIKVYSYGKVWRYENPQQGRYREFMQMDIDIFGSKSMLCETELLSLVARILKKIGLVRIKIFINNRKILQGFFEEELKLDKEKVTVAIRILDKLKKIGEEGVKKELKENNIDPNIFNKIKDNLLLNNSNFEKLELLEKTTVSPLVKEGIQELKEILNYSKGLEYYDKITVDFTLARGLDYYTGPIFEVVLEDHKELGSINGGGRYDSLVELFSGYRIPAVGISFGIERIIDFIEKNEEIKKRLMKKEEKVLVTYRNEEQIEKCIKIVNTLRDNNIIADFDLMERSLKKQLKYANEKGFTKVIFIEENNKLTLKDLETGNQEEKTIEEIIRDLKKY